MEPSNLEDEYRGVNCDEIRWTSDPIDPFETAVDIRTLDVEALLVYAVTLQSETRTVRELLRDALATVHRLTRQCDRYQDRVHLLVTELRQVRAEVCALRIQLRAWSDV